MKKLTCVLVMLAMAATASATLRLFVTPASAGYGLDGYPGGTGTGFYGYEINPFRPTFSTQDLAGNVTWGYDFYYGYYKVTSFPPSNYPSGSCANPTLINPGDFGYLWFQFVGETKNAKVNALKILVVDCATGQPAGADVFPTYYQQNDIGNPTAPNMRWNGAATPPDYSQWHLNPQGLVAITAAGFTNSTADIPWNMYKGANDAYGATRIALLGSLTGAFNGKTYEVKIIDYSYWTGTPTTVVLASGFFKLVPEPAALALMGLAGLLLRRR